MNFFRALLALFASAVGLVLALPVLALGAPFWAVSGLTRLARWAVERLGPRGVARQKLIQFEPVIGWKPRPNLDIHAIGSGLFHLTTDAEGWRGRVALEEADVVVFGDSFAFGHSADDDVFFADLDDDVRIKAIGCNGYSMVHGLLWMGRYAPGLAGRTVVWLIYYGNDLLENLRPNLGRYRMPFVREVRDATGWEIVTEHVRPEPWPFESQPAYTRKLAEICCDTFLSRRVFSACEFLIARARDLCDRVGARLVVMGNPDIDQMHPDRSEWFAGLAPDPETFDPSLPDSRLAEICARLGVPFVALSEILEPEDHLPDDCHWGLSGHRRVADLLARVHRSVPVVASERPERASPRPTGGGDGAEALRVGNRAEPPPQRSGSSTRADVKP